MQEATQTSTSWPENLVCTLAYKNAKEAGGGGGGGLFVISP